MKRSFILLTLFSSACVGHILPYTPKIRSYNPDTYAAARPANAPGSIFVDGSGWIADIRSRNEGDIITIRIEEGENASHKATTRLQKDTKFSVGIPALLGAMSQIAKAIPGLDPNQLIAATTASQHRGDGETMRSGRVQATLPVRIKRVLPNGDLYIEGSKVVLVNSEEHHIYLSGVVRPVDLFADNSVSSSRIADLQVELTGRGVVTAKQNPGWANRILDYVWPF